MYPVSKAFQEALRGQHTVVFKFEMLGPTGQVLEDVNFEIVDGYVTEDRTAEIRRRCNVHIPYEQSNIPNSTSHPLHPLSGNEFKVYRGIQFPDGTEELVPQGIFRVETVDVDESGSEKTLSIQAFDRSREVQRATLICHCDTIAAGTNYAVAIQELIEKVRPGRFVYSYESINAVTPNLIFGADHTIDPWAKAREMAESVAHDLYFDSNGVSVLRPAPLIGRDTRVATYQGSDLYLGGSTQISSKDVHNHVVVYGEPPSADDPPVRGEAYDDDPTSPTYVGDPVGSGNFYSPTAMSSEYVTSEEQANELAAARLRQVLRQKRTASLRSAVNPALRAGDIIRVIRPELGTYKEFVIESIRTPLSIGGEQTMELTE